MKIKCSIISEWIYIELQADTQPQSSSNCLATLSLSLHLYARLHTPKPTGKMFSYIFTFLLCLHLLYGYCFYCQAFNSVCSELAIFFSFLLSLPCCIFYLYSVNIMYTTRINVVYFRFLYHSWSAVCARTHIMSSKKFSNECKWIRQPIAKNETATRQWNKKWIKINIHNWIVLFYLL